MSINIKPCPFCGHEPDIKTSRFISMHDSSVIPNIDLKIKCTNKMCFIRPEIECDHDNAIKFWNKRYE